MPGNVHGGESNPKCTMAAKLNTSKRCVMAVPADVGKPTRKAVVVRVKEYSLLTAFLMCLD